MVAKKPAAAAVPKKKTKKGEKKEEEPLMLEDKKEGGNNNPEAGAKDEGQKGEKEVEPNLAQAQAKAKGKQQSKAKAKAKANKSSKEKPASSSKKKVANKKLKKKSWNHKKDKEEDEKKLKQKSKQSMKEKTASWRVALAEKEKKQEGEEGEEEEQAEGDPEVTPDETRHFAKARKFAKMLKKGQLPEEIKLMYEQAAQQSATPRLFRTEMINRLFQKNKKNEWVMVTGSPEFSSWKQSQDRKFSTAKSVGVGGHIMLWQTFHGDKSAMEAAARDGDIFQQGGLWHYKQVETGRTKELTDNMEMSGGKVDLTVDDFSDLSSWMTSRPWAKYGQHVPELGNSVAFVQALHTKVKL